MATSISLTIARYITGTGERGSQWKISSTKGDSSERAGNPMNLFDAPQHREKRGAFAFTA